MPVIDFTQSTPQDRAVLLGEEFRNVYVVESDCHRYTKIVVEDMPFTLLGRPDEAFWIFLNAALGSSEITLH